MKCGTDSILTIEKREKYNGMKCLLRVFNVFSAVVGQNIMFWLGAHCSLVGSY
jgi:hypothetical protein